MYRLVLPFFLLVHVAPVFYFYTAKTWLEQLIVAMLQGAFLLGMFAVSAASKDRIVEPDFQRFRSRRMLYLVFVVYAVLRWPFITQVVSALANGTYLTFALELAKQRYANGEGDITPFYNVGTVFFFAYAFLLGAFVPKVQRRAFPIALLVFSLVIESSSLAKAGVVIALVGFATEALIRSNLRFIQIGQLRIWKYMLAAGVLGVAVIAVIGYARLRGTPDALHVVLFEKVPGYTIASHGALLEWLKTADPTYALGFNSFTFAFKLLGANVPQGMYELIDTSVGETNVFLIYRGLIDDFGLVGAALLLFAFGFSIMYHSIKTPGPLGYLFLRVALLLVLFPPLSVFNFTTVAAGFFVSYLLVMWEQVTWGVTAASSPHATR